MKRIFNFIIIFLFSSYAFSQISYKEMSLDQIRTSSNTLLEEFDINPNGSTIMNDKLLNVFFAKEITSYLSSSSSLSLSRAYAFLDNTDGRLSIGGTFTNQSDKLDKLSHILQAGVKANIKEGFSTLFKEGDQQKDIGLAFKYTLLGNGTIKPFTSTANNQKLSYRTYSSYITEQLDFERKGKIAAFEKKLDSYQGFSDVDKEEELKGFYQSIDNEYTLKYAESEAKYLSDNKLYTLAWDWWLSIETYIPLTESEYNFSSDITGPSFEKVNYKPYEIKLTPTFLFLVPTKGKLFVSPRISIYQNNIVKTEEVESVDFEDYINQGGIDTLNMALINADKVYIGSFEKFWTYQCGFQLAYFFPGNADFIGLSGEINWEKGGGCYSSRNWKFGIPISLKDENGKPKVNFELQCRETSNVQSVGISVGLPFGSLIY